MAYSGFRKGGQFELPKASRARRRRRRGDEAWGEVGMGVPPLQG